MVNLTTYKSNNSILDKLTVGNMPIDIGYSITGVSVQLDLLNKQKGKSPKEIEFIKKLKQLIIKGSESFEKGDYLEAEKIYKAALAQINSIIMLGAGDAGVWHIKGLIQYILREYADALHSFNKALKLHPDSGRMWLYKGLTLVPLQKFEEATDAFEQAYRYPEIGGNNKTALYAGWSDALLFGALQAQLSRDSELVEYWADYWGDVKERGKEDGFDSVMEEILTRIKEKLPEKELRAFLKLEKKLRRMEDPLYRLKALRDSISRKWPKGLSSVEAIREDRD